MNEYAWLSRCVLLLALIGCGGTAEPTDASPPADAGSGGDATPDEGEDASADGGDAAPDAGCIDLDDGVDCTLDTCVDGVAEHSPDDLACNSVGGDPVCDAMGLIVQDVGVCDPRAGCVVDTQTLEDCTDPAPTASCTGSAATSDLTFNAAVGICDDGSGAPACGGQATLCETTTPTSCAGGMLTAATPTCDGVAGCGEGVDTTACETRPPRCEGPTHITYSPACADGTSCLPLGTETRTGCRTPGPSCVGGVHTTWAATCDAATGCDSTPLIETDCAAMEGRRCTSPRSFVRTTCRCDDVTGCSCRDELFFCTDVCCT